MSAANARKDVPDRLLSRGIGEGQRTLNHSGFQPVDSVADNDGCINKLSVISDPKRNYFPKVMIADDGGTCNGENDGKSCCTPFQPPIEFEDEQTVWFHVL